MKVVRIHVAHWLEKPRVEGPITPDDAGDLAHAFVWDGEYARAHQLADDLTKHYIGSKDYRGSELWAKWLAVRSTLFAVIANENFKREARSRARRAKR